MHAMSPTEFRARPTWSCPARTTSRLSATPRRSSRDRADARCEGDLSIDVPPLPLLPGEFSDRGAAAVLSARERDVLRWVARGKTNAEIATALYITESTVRKHLQ